MSIRIITRFNSSDTLRRFRSYCGTRDTVRNRSDGLIIDEFLDRDVDPVRPLQREQFETLHRRITDSAGAFDLDRLPPDADPYPAVLSLHPRFEIDEDAGVIREHDGPTTSQLLDIEQTGDQSDGKIDRSEPDLNVYADALLLIDALERHEVDSLTELETEVLVNLYTLCSDVQRNADSLRKEIADVLLGRLHHDQPVSGPFGSIQRTSRRNKSLKDEQTVIERLEQAGVDREQVTSLDRSKVDDVLDVTELAESDVYDIEESEYAEFDLQAYSVEEIFAEKLRAIYQRGAARDYYDLYQLLEAGSVTVDFADVRPSFEAKCDHDNLTVDLTDGVPAEQRETIRHQWETTLPDLTGDPPAFEMVWNRLDTAISQQKSP